MGTGTKPSHVIQAGEMAPILLGKPMADHHVAWKLISGDMSCIVDLHTSNTGRLQYIAKVRIGNHFVFSGTKRVDAQLAANDVERYLTRILKPSLDGFFT